MAGTHAGRKFTGTLSDGDTLELGDGAVLRFTGRRTRMLAMLTGAPEAQTSATAASEV